MSATKPSTLLVFTLGPGREQARKRCLGGRFARLERRLHAQCLEGVLAAGRAAGCRLRVCAPGGVQVEGEVVGDRQAEAGFGRRLLGAIRRAGEEAGGPLIVVGSDTPALDGELLRQALAALARDPQEVVIGPATDGGIYLLAFAAPLVAELEAVPWRSRRTLSALVAAVRRTGRPVRLLPALADLDGRSDLERWLAAGRAAVGLAAGALGAALAAALRRLAWSPLPVPSAAPALAWCRIPTGRAPPR
jgi:glycosyltransferase A (GT-A) superfamily protein (DUF2064 family)